MTEPRVVCRVAPAEMLTRPYPGTSMRTRTLMLLSLLCGLLILFAGVALLIQLVNRADVEPPREIGEAVTVGDMVVVVEGSSETGTLHTVQLDIGGVADPEGADGFRMIASARPAPLLESCGATTVEVRSCELVFEVSDDAGSRQLIYDRGDQTARWILQMP
ncbi:MAG: hypothetical protein EA389_13860 [Ilumatobacter sp.]|nr:MAG: hypothetical protein EA389_13860 [Ilumatobacter sp.]